MTPGWFLALAVVGCTGQGDDSDSTATEDTDTQAATLEALAVVDLGIDCSGDGGPGRTCQTVEITCEGLAPATVELRRSDPPSGVAVRGTVVAGSGGDGASWWNSGTEDAVDQLRQSGVRFVERRWLTPWMDGEAGFIAAACRYAGVLKWVHQEVDPDGPLCAVGNSVGASEVGTLLVSRDEHFLLAGAVLLAGPPFTRLDHACLPALDDGWGAQCETLADAHGLCRTGTQECTVHDDGTGEIPALIDLAFDGTPCGDQDVDALAELQAQSTWPPATVAGSLPVPVQVLVGGNDCVEAAPFGLLFAELAGVPGGSVPGANHKLQASPEGVEAVAQALEETCFPP